MLMLKKSRSFQLTEKKPKKVEKETWASEKAENFEKEHHFHSE